jgi:hypothetical protein
MFSVSSNISQFNLNTSASYEDSDPVDFKKANSNKEVRQNLNYMSPVVSNNIYSKFMYQNVSNQNIRSMVLSPVNSTINSQQKINLDLVKIINLDYEKKRKAYYCDDKTYTK